MISLTLIAALAIGLAFAPKATGSAIKLLAGAFALLGAVLICVARVAASGSQRTRFW
jgi:hypothetical protein